MPRRNPDHRARAALLSVDPPEHPFERALWDFRHGNNTSDVIERVYELHESGARDNFRGWLLATSNDEDIVRRTRVAMDVVRAYRHLFFDVHVFRDHFDLIDWVKSLAQDPRSTTESLQYIRWAVMYGPEAIAFMSGLPTYLDARQVQEQSMHTSYFRSLMGRDAPLDSSEAREALKHTQVAVGQAAALAKASPPSARDFAVKLKHREMTSSIEVVDKTTEVLH